ncbi:hypothetical protein [Streptomyces sp. NBC_01373]|uniref:hypothetical protein n=1 Tax=Streptomyces sp. NBC_01373 TaxID=2903843 RepID=UPI002255BE24|nr:hypothetical protein [Streptomyces sp. NBC_01373]MCX4697046.1 hypothetical protein [Streptomyces sp. NBC_01373]MCX4707029.1 hypothetical protein [Streptomyces sp. NBC_01373]
MTNFDVPKTPAEFVKSMLRDGIESDLLAVEHVNDRDLREPNIHAAVAAYVAANAMHNLRLNSPEAADILAERLAQVITAGDLAGPLYRAAKHLDLDPDQWITEFNERAARRGAKPEAGRRAAHIALTTLADRWKQMGGPAPDPDEGLFVDEPSPAEYARVERAATYREVAADLLETLRTGQIPHPLMTDAELEQHGTPEGAAS